jgi:hypothetical protein
MIGATWFEDKLTLKYPRNPPIICIEFSMNVYDIGVKLSEVAHRFMWDPPQEEVPFSNRPAGRPPDDLQGRYLLHRFIQRSPRGFGPRDANSDPQ